MISSEARSYSRDECEALPVIRYSVIHLYTRRNSSQAFPVARLQFYLVPLIVRCGVCLWKTLVAFRWVQINHNEPRISRWIGYVKIALLAFYVSYLLAQRIRASHGATP